MHPHLAVDHHGATTVIRLLRPEKRNALSRSMLGALADALAEAGRTGAAAVLTGDADVFSAGYDLGELGRGESDVQADDAIAAAAAAIAGLSVPVVAAIEGACVGAAVELALACDVRIAARDAFFAVPAARLGILYRPEAVAAMLAVVGRETAMRLLVLGLPITGDEAVSARLASIVVDPGHALEVALATTAPLVRGSREALAATKELIVTASAARPDLPRFEEIRRALLRSEERRRLLAGSRAGRPAAEGRGIADQAGGRPGDTDDRGDRDDPR